jgi:hypothetical protein
MSEQFTILELVSQVTEFNDVHELVQDENLDEALAIVIKLIMRPDVPPAKAMLMIVQLQALSAKFQILAMHYTSIDPGKSGTINNKKKNVYYTMSDAIDKLVSALKYTVRTNGL